MSNDNYGDQPTGGATQLQKRLGKYELVRPLGRGGMGEVWLAVDTVADVQVALKMLPPELRYSEEAQEQIRQSYRRIHGLHHPAICSVKDLVLEPGIGFFLVMDYFDGVTLSKYRSDYVDRHGSFPLEEVVRVLTPVAQALDHAHQSGIVHRDIKPTNILVNRDGKDARIIDFQLAADIRTSLTRFTKVAVDTSGTFPYMAPEQFLGQRANARTDIYALAMVAYELLVGDLPYEAVSFEQWKSIITDPRSQMPSPNLLSGPASAAVHSCLAQDPEARAATCVEFIQSLIPTAHKPSSDAATATSANSDLVQSTGDPASAHGSGKLDKLMQPSQAAALAEQVANDKFFSLLSEYTCALRYRDWTPKLSKAVICTIFLLATSTPVAAGLILVNAKPEYFRNPLYMSVDVVPALAFCCLSGIVATADRIGWKLLSLLVIVVRQSLDLIGSWLSGTNQWKGLLRHWLSRMSDSTARLAAWLSQRDGWTNVLWAWVDKPNAKVPELRNSLSTSYPVRIRKHFGMSGLDNEAFVYRVACELATAERLQNLGLHRYRYLAAFLAFPFGVLGLRKFLTGRHFAGLTHVIISCTMLVVSAIFAAMAGRFFLEDFFVATSVGLYAQTPVILAECVIYLRTDTAYFYKHYWIGRREWF